MLANRTSGLASKAAARLQAISSQLANGHATSSSVGRLKAEETALFVCDIQERFKPIIAGFPAVVDTAQRMLKGANALEIPVVVTEQYPKALGSTVQEIKEVLAQNAFVQDKLDFTMFVDPVKQHMRSLSQRKKTAVDLIEEGYEVHLVVDGVSSKRPSDRATAIHRISQMGGLLVSSEMALFQLCGHSKHPAFKAISALAKEDRPEFLPMSSSL